MPPARKMNRSAGYSDDEDAELSAPPLFAAMPDEIANNGFGLSNTNNMANTNNPQPSPGVPGAGLFGAPTSIPPGQSVGSVGAGRQGGLFPTSAPSQRVDPAEALAKFNKAAQENRKKREAEEGDPTGQDGSASCNEPPLTNNSSQQQQNQTGGSGLFGSSSAQPANSTTGGSGLFGGTQQQSQPQQQGGLFGGANPPQQQGGLFGGTNNQQQSQPQQQQGGLFGGANQQQQSQPRQGGGLFGGTNQQQQQNQSNNAGGGMFGAQQPNQAGGLGGILGGGASQQTQSGTGGGLFGGTSTQPKPSVFAGAASGLGNSSTLGAGTNMFGGPAQPSSIGTAFASNANPPGQSQPSLLGAAQHSRLNQSAPFGRLSMGQSGAPSTTVGAVKIDADSLKPTTRFDDCVDPVKDQLEKIDKMIQQQESFCKQIEAFCPMHGENVESIAPDVEYIKNKADDAEQALISDAQGVEAQRRNADKDTKDLERCHRVITNLTLPQPYQYSGSVGMGGLGSMYGSQQRPQQAMLTPAGEDPSSYDMDLIGNYFVPMATELQKTVNDYAKTLTEIESHMRVMESSAIAQAQQLAQQKNGMGGGQMSSEDTVRELADTLRGFEQSILGVAGVVGECREGVNELVLGRLGGNLP